MMYRLAQAPSRSHNSFTLSFGLLNLNLSVLTSTEETRVVRKEFLSAPDGLHEVGRCAYDKATGEVLDDNSPSVMKYAWDEATQQWVMLSDWEIEQATFPKKVAKVANFVPLTKLRQQYLVKGMAQVRAKTSGLKGAQVAQVQHTFSLLLSAMKERKVAALIHVGLRGPATYAAITPDGDLLWLHPADGVRKEAALPISLHSKQEMEMACALIDTVGVHTPILIDATAQAVNKYVAEKAQRMAAGKPEPVQTDDDVTPVTESLLAALAQSIININNEKQVAS
jgi:non-homologous end joining protein Ku